jgi:hypothetical protein
MAHGTREARSRRRRGGTLGGLLLILSLVGTLTVTTVVVGPRYLAADPPPPPEEVAAITAVHQGVIDDLGEIVERSVGVLALHERGATPYLEMVLWLADDPQGADGRPDGRELAVLSHSAVLQTITIYRLAGDDQRATGPASDRWDSPAFCDHWRADPRVVPLVLARGVSDMRVERVGSAQDEWVAWGRWGGLQRLRLALTWAPDSADGADEASVLVNTVMFPYGGGEEIDRTREASEKPLAQATTDLARSSRRTIGVGRHEQR